jgi:hypothetical protein
MAGQRRISPRRLPPPHPARRISLRSASARLNSTRTTDHCSVLQRVCNITRSTRLMRSQGWLPRRRPFNGVSQYQKSAYEDATTNQPPHRRSPSHCCRPGTAPHRQRRRGLRVPHRVSRGPMESRIATRSAPGDRQSVDAAATASTRENGASYACHDATRRIGGALRAVGDCRANMTTALGPRGATTRTDREYGQPSHIALR